MILINVLAIYGSSGLGREILDLASEVNNTSKSWDKIIFLNDFEHKSTINGTEVLDFDNFKNIYSSVEASVVIAVGEPRSRQILRKKVITAGYRLQSLIHPASHIGTDAQICDGAIVQYGSFISCGVKIGDNALIQFNATLGHDSVIGKDSVVSTCASISGNCVVGEQTYISINVPIKEKLTIGSNTIIGMGSVIMRNIPDNVVVLGNPARIIANNVNGTVFK